MQTINPQYIIDKKGNKISVVISVTEFETIMEELEELEDIRLYDESKSNDDSSIPIDDAFEMIEKKRKNKK
jgi:PHD/YefM family antitoxin component YafN of YafNO toxin-antitoxin module